MPINIAAARFPHPIEDVTVTHSKLSTCHVTIEPEFNRDIREGPSMRIFRTARLPLFGATLAALAACVPIEEQCSSRYAASDVAYDQCVERHHKAINRMLEDRRLVHQNMSIPDTP